MRRYDVDWGHLAFLLAIAGAVCWYLADAASVSLAANNLLFIGPIGCFALVLCVVITRQCVRPAGTVAHQGRTDVIDIAQPTRAGSGTRIAGVAAALVLLVALLGVLGFDGAILLFSGVTMAICGERRLVPLLVYPIVVTLVIVLAFRAILPFPMYTVLL